MFWERRNVPLRVRSLASLSSRNAGTRLAARMRIAPLFGTRCIPRHCDVYLPRHRGSVPVRRSLQYELRIYLCTRGVFRVTALALGSSLYA